MESSHSGLVRHLGKVVWGQLHQEFKSPTLRKIRSKATIFCESAEGNPEALR